MSDRQRPNTRSVLKFRDFAEVYERYDTAVYMNALEQCIAELEVENKRRRCELIGQYDAYIDALKFEHATLLSTGHGKAATGTTRAMMILGEIHDAILKEDK